MEVPPRRANKESGEQDKKGGTEQGVGSEGVLQRVASAWLPGTDSEVMIPGSATPSSSGIKTLSTSKTANVLVKTGFDW